MSVAARLYFDSTMVALLNITSGRCELPPQGSEPFKPNLHPILQSLVYQLWLELHNCKSRYEPLWVAIGSRVTQYIDQSVCRVWKQLYLNLSKCLWTVSYPEQRHYKDIVCSEFLDHGAVSVILESFLWNRLQTFLTLIPFQRYVPILPIGSSSTIPSKC